MEASARIPTHLPMDLIYFSTSVWRAVDQKSGKSYAVKMINKEQADSQPNYNIKKEVLIHESLSHPHIIKLVEARRDEKHYYLVMEWGSGGELFEKIEPDVGFPIDIAHMYFKQLMLVLKYLGEEGVAHRDIKPENMLVDASGNLKITDFGLATVFKQHGQRRILHTPCGTAMYMAPEVLAARTGYEGDKADMWSAAVVLFVMVAGCHPWEEPTIRCGHYDCFLKSRCHSYSPWNKFDPELKDLLLSILKHNPEERLDIDGVLAHPWMLRPNPLINEDGSCKDPKRLAELLEASHAASNYSPVLTDDDDRLSSALTQIEMSAIFSQAAHTKALLGFSQPVTSMTVNEADQVLHIQRLARFYTRAPMEAVLERLQKQLNTMLVQHKAPSGSNQIIFATVDRRKGPLTGEITVHRLSDELNLVLFTKAKGDAIEFKRFFKFVISDLKDLIVQH